MWRFFRPVCRATRRHDRLPPRDIAIRGEWFSFGLAGVDHVKHIDVTDPIDQFVRYLRASQLTNVGNSAMKAGQSLANPLDRLRWGCRFPTTMVLCLAGSHLRSTSSFRKWVEQLMHGS